MDRKRWPRPRHSANDTPESPGIRFSISQKQSKLLPGDNILELFHSGKGFEATNPTDKFVRDVQPSNREALEEANRYGTWPW